jgi:hypothetical protein
MPLNVALGPHGVLLTGLPPCCAPDCALSVLNLVQMDFCRRPPHTRAPRRKVETSEIARVTFAKTAARFKDQASKKILNWEG